MGEIVLLGVGFPFTYSFIPVMGGLAAGKIVTHIEFSENIKNSREIFNIINKELDEIVKK